MSANNPNIKSGRDQYNYLIDQTSDADYATSIKIVDGTPLIFRFDVDTNGITEIDFKYWSEDYEYPSEIPRAAPKTDTLLYAVPMVVGGAIVSYLLLKKYKFPYKRK